MTRRLFLLVAFALAVGACTSTTIGSTTTSVATTTSAPEDTTTTTETTTTTTIPNGPLPGTEELSDEVREEMVRLVGVTEEIRELQFLEMPTVTVVTAEELESRVRAQIEEDAVDFPADAALYKLLGLLEEDVDLETMITDLYGEQVAGYYDGETRELVVPITTEGFSVVQQATLVHELTHALTDQNFDFDPIFEAMIDEERLDQASAYQALIEGDASLAELHYLQTLSQAELGEFFAEALVIDTSALDAAPQFLQDSLIFPYDSGLAFTQELYNSGGWEAVNEAYTTMPGLPGSTEQVISPDDFERDLPVEVPSDTVSVPGYELERTSVWGELGFRIMIDQVLGQDTGVDAADGWGGDYYSQWFDGTNAALLLVYEGDTNRDTEELRQALAEYAATVFEEDYVSVEVKGGQLMFIAADEKAVGELIHSAMAN
ncbi:MAG TPA: hypothetical protein VI980_00060 [Acidimicrobiia bacterium]|nr:hypothetical protein [Acidimicrobiia bacterium]